MDHPNVGLQACWYGSFYGTADYIHSPVPGTGNNNTEKDSVIGMHLWYGRDPTILEESQLDVQHNRLVQAGKFHRKCPCRCGMLLMGKRFRLVRDDGQPRELCKHAVEGSQFICRDNIRPSSQHLGEHFGHYSERHVQHHFGIYQLLLHATERRQHRRIQRQL